MMDINERLMEIDDADQLAILTAEVLAVEDDINQKLAQLNDRLCKAGRYRKEAG